MMRVESSRSFSNGAARLADWASPHLKKVALTPDQLAKIRSAKDPAAALREVYIAHKSQPR